VDRGGRRTVDPQRGVKLNSNYWYWCPELRDPRFAHKKVPVRYDPWDASIAYVCLKDRWVAARCRALSKLNVMTVKERELYTAEMRRRNLLAPGEEANSQKLLEFSRAFTPEGVTEKHLLQQKANRQLYGELNLGVEPDGESTAPTSTFRFRSITDELTADNDELDIEIPDGEPWDLDETDLPTYERF